MYNCVRENLYVNYTNVIDQAIVTNKLLNWATMRAKIMGLIVRIYYNESWNIKFQMVGFAAGLLVVRSCFKKIMIILKVK